MVKFTQYNTAKLETQKIQRDLWRLSYESSLNKGVYIGG